MSRAAPRMRADRALRVPGPGARGGPGEATPVSDRPAAEAFAAVAMPADQAGLRGRLHVLAGDTGN